MSEGVRAPEPGAEEDAIMEDVADLFVVLKQIFKWSAVRALSALCNTLTQMYFSAPAGPGGKDKVLACVRLCHEQMEAAAKTAGIERTDA